MNNNPTNLHILGCTLNEDGTLASITIASDKELKSYVYNTTFLKTIDNTVYSEKAPVDLENPGNYKNQRNPYNGFEDPVNE